MNAVGHRSHSFAALLASSGDRHVAVPAVYDEHCTDSVLTSEFIDALPLAEVPPCPAHTRTHPRAHARARTRTRTRAHARYTHAAAPTNRCRCAALRGAQVFAMDERTRNHVALTLLRLTLRELIVYRFMQVCRL